MTNKILELKNITVGYEANRPILNDVNLNIYQNDFLGIIGPNGGGKTTLLKTILGLIKPSTGNISFYKKDQSVNRLNIGYLPQINQIDRKFPISVFDVILSGLTPRRKFFTYFTNEQKQQAKDVASRMGLDALINKPIGNLSGGQLQRTLLGRAIVDNPDLLILDEPNSYVDKRFETNFYKILEEINSSTAIIIVSHDVGTVISLVKNIACVNEGLHYHSGANVSSEWLEQTYTSCPIEIVGHGDFPHRILEKHDGCKCCDTTPSN